MWCHRVCNWLISVTVFSHIIVNYILLIVITVLYTSYIIVYTIFWWPLNVQGPEEKLARNKNLLLTSHWGGLNINVCACMLVAQSCWTLCDPVDCPPPSFSVHEILQAGVLEWVAIPFSRGSSPPRDRTQVSCIEGRLFTIWAAREALNINLVNINWLCLSRLVLI